VTTPRKEGFGERFVPDLAATPRTAMKENAALKLANVAFEYVASLGDGTKAEHWRPVTYYPTDA